MKLLAITLLAISIVVPTQYLVAQSTTTDEVVTETIVESTVIEEEVATPEVRNTERRAALSARSQARITNLAANLSNRFDVVIVRLNNILGRIDSRITKLEATGRNMDEAKNYVATARTSLARAERNISTIDTQVAMVVGATNPREEWQNLKNTYTSTRELVRSAHADMRAAVLVLKISPSAEPIASGEDTSN